MLRICFIPNVCLQRDKKLKISFITSYLGNIVHKPWKGYLAISWMHFCNLHHTEQEL
jgi:hypothetical protein